MHLKNRDTRSDKFFYFHFIFISTSRVSDLRVDDNTRKIHTIIQLIAQPGSIPTTHLLEFELLRY